MIHKPVSRSEAKRLGKPGAYRLGSAAGQGTERAGPPRPLAPGFSRPRHPGPASAWLLAAVAATILVAVGALAGWWFSPFAAGVAAGLAARAGDWRPRASVPCVILVTSLGWGLALWALALLGNPALPAAREIAVLAGLPARAVAGIGLTIAVSVLQGLAGLWLGRALAPRPARD